MLFLALLLGKGLKSLEAAGLSAFGAGSLSNWLDRIFLNGVVDFLNFALPGFQPYIFNMADVAIGVGLALTALSVVFRFAVSLSRMYSTVDRQRG